LAFERSFEANAGQMTRVLDAWSARLLWADVIAQAESNKALIDVEQVALLAQQADSLLWQWHIDVPPSWQTPDYVRFLEWRQAYEARLRAQAAVDSDRLVDRVMGWVRDEQVAVAEHLSVGRV
jgi:hypothetical protein